MRGLAMVVDVKRASLFCPQSFLRKRFGICRESVTAEASKQQIVLIMTLSNESVLIEITVHR